MDATEEREGFLVSGAWGMRAPSGKKIAPERRGRESAAAVRASKRKRASMRGSGATMGARAIFVS